jgi:uncharacterized protein YndB with AHSA1/START domain
VASLEVTERIAASPAEVWALIGDPTAMAGLAEECVTMEWTGGWRQAEVGARFRGHNRSGWRRWTTSCTVVEYEPGSSIAWDVAFGPLPVARWGYRLEPDGDAAGGTTVRESFQDRRPPALRVLSPVVRGTRDTVGLNRANMTTTLGRLKARAEAGAR